MLEKSWESWANTYVSLQLVANYRPRHTLRIPPMHCGIVQGVFAASRFPDQRRRALTQTLQRILCLLRTDFLTGFFLIEAECFSIVRTVTRALLKHPPQYGLF